MKYVGYKAIKHFLCLSLAFVMVTAAACSSDGNSTGEKEYSHKVIDNGQSDYCIVISDKATQTEQFAAQELSSFIKEVSDVNLAVKTDNVVSYGKDTKAICIGSNKLFDSADIKITSEQLNTDGFVIKKKNDMIFISGACDRGTLYGVYEFIERYLGVRFLTYDTTYVPKKEGFATEENIDITEVPKFEMRQYYCKSVSVSPLFATRMRMIYGSSTTMKKYGGGYGDKWFDSEFHNTLTMTKTSHVWGEHTEWFKDNDPTKTVCYTNGITDDGELDESMDVSAVKAVIEALKRKILDSSPTQEYFMIGQQDGVSPCSCARCSESAKKNGSPTGTMLVWMNVICREIEKWAAVAVPDKNYKICCFAYQWSQNCPVTKDAGNEYKAVSERVIPHKNLYVMYAPINACYYHSFDDKDCTQNMTIMAQLDGWKALTDRILVWDYACNFRNYLWWFPNISSMTDNLKIYYEHGVSMVRTQAAHSDNTGYQQLLEAYLYGKLMWNYEQNIYDLIHEFNKYYFGEGAAHIDDFVDLFESHFATLKMHTDLYENIPAFLSIENYPLELMQKAIDYTEKGFQAIVNTDRTQKEKDLFLTRFERASIMPRYMILRNIENYLDGAEKEQFLKTFFALADKFEMTNYGEGNNFTIEKLKEKYGY